MKLRDYIDGDYGRVLDGVVLRVPKARRLPDMPKDAAIRSTWGMGGGRCGVWFTEPGTREGRVWPVTGIDVEKELMEWEVVTE